VDDDVIARLKLKLDQKERAQAFKEARYVTAWVYEIIKRLANFPVSAHFPV
jgi:hypothetical protein